MIHKYIII